MSTHERPGVYTDYSVSGIVRGSTGRGGAVGLAATAEKGEAGAVVPITEYAAAIETFGGGNLAALVKLLLKNGASVVYCCKADGDDYETAFAALMAFPEIRYMVCDSREADVHKRLLDVITHADEKSKYRIGIVESENAALECAGTFDRAAAVISGVPGLHVRELACGAPAPDPDTGMFRLSGGVKCAGLLTVPDGGDGSENMAFTDFVLRGELHT